MELVWKIKSQKKIFVQNKKNNINKYCWNKYVRKKKWKKNEKFKNYKKIKDIKNQLSNKSKEKNNDNFKKLNKKPKKVLRLNNGQ